MVVEKICAALWRTVLLVGLVIGATATAAAQATGAPDKVIEGLNAKLLETMKRAKSLGVKGRYDALAPTLTKVYDIPGMTRVAVGLPWDGLQPDQRTNLVDAFTRMMLATYAKRFDDYAGEKFEILQTVDQQPADKMVKTRIVTDVGKIYALNYVMRPIGGEWRIVDVYLDGTISELVSRRAEFSSILKSSGPDGLLAAIRRQADKLLVEGGG